MSEDRAEKLVAILCDKCGAKIKPHPEIAKSGWMIMGTRGVAYRLHYCPTCWLS